MSRELLPARVEYFARGSFELFPKAIATDVFICKAVTLVRSPRKMYTRKPAVRCICCIIHNIIIIIQAQYIPDIYAAAFDGTSAEENSEISLPPMF